MIKVKVPATTANLGVGFDVLGMSLSLYNNFYFKRADKFSFGGFAEIYCNDNNLVKTSYEYVFKYFEKKVFPVHIMIEENIPIARGLGSSSSCVVAGVLAANYFLDNICSEEDLFNLCCEIEGHPDNVAPALLGGLIASYRVNDKYKSIKYEVNNNLKFITVIPPFEMSTEEARKILPVSLDYKDVVHNLGRIINLPLAFKLGNIKMIQELLDDKLHEPYRLPIIDKAFDIKELVEKEGYAFCLSGSGSTLLIIGSDNSIIDKLRIFNYDIKELFIGEKAKVEEVK